MQSAAAFRHEIKKLRKYEEQLQTQSFLSMLQSGMEYFFLHEVKSLNPTEESLPMTVIRISGETNIAGLWGDNLQTNSFDSADYRDHACHECFKTRSRSK